MKLAALDPILAILVAVGWFIVKALLNRREDTDTWAELERPAAPSPHVPGRGQGQPPPKITKPNPQSLPPLILLPQKPKTAVPPSSPPIIRTVPTPRPVLIEEPEGPTRELAHLKQSQESYTRAAQIQETVAKRLSAIDQQTQLHKPAAPKVRTRPAAAAHILRTFRNPATVRQAFLASFVLNPPKALE